jgi:adenylate cyclase
MLAGALDEPIDTALFRQAARKAVVLDSHNPRAQLFLAFAHGQAGSHVEMLRTLERAIEVGPSSPSAHGGLGLALAFGGKSEEAIANLEKAIHLDPKSRMLSSWLNLMALAHFAAQRYEEAVEWAKRSSRENPDDAYAHRTLAASYAQLGRFDDARQALAEQLRREREISITKVMSEPWNPYAAPEFRERYIEGLRKAGMPE